MGCHRKSSEVSCTGIRRRWTDSGRCLCWEDQEQVRTIARCSLSVLYVTHVWVSGKGTQCALMEDNYPCVHLSVGELLRAEQKKEDSPHRELIEATLVAGKIVPVEISLGLLTSAMEEKAKELGRDIFFLVDGFPRNFDNLEGWCKYVPHSTILWSVLVYHCPLDVLEARILERAKDSGRSDDNIKSVQKRFTTFEKDTMPVIECLRETSERVSSAPYRVVDISGDAPLDDVWASSQRALDDLVRHDILTANAALLRAVENGDCEAYSRRCDPLFFDDKTDPVDTMSAQEGSTGPVGPISGAQLEVITGKEVAVSYQRSMEGVVLTEKRIWQHQGESGWRNIHFTRTPAM